MLAPPQPPKKAVDTVTFADVLKEPFKFRFSNDKDSNQLTKYLSDGLTKVKA